MFMDLSHSERLRLAYLENCRREYKWTMYAVHLAHSTPGNVKFARVRTEALNRAEPRSQNQEHKLPMESAVHLPANFSQPASNARPIRPSLLRSSGVPQAQQPPVLVAEDGVLGSAAEASAPLASTAKGLAAASTAEALAVASNVEAPAAARTCPKVAGFGDHCGGRDGEGAGGGCGDCGGAGGSELCEGAGCGEHFGCRICEGADGCKDRCGVAGFSEHCAGRRGGSAGGRAGCGSFCLI
eukprot:6181419-Pleurochrysis_carterae.AAC.2